jgi:hypothetical protein
MRYIVNSNNITEEPKEKYPQHQEIKCYNRKKGKYQLLINRTLVTMNYMIEQKEERRHVA